MNMLPSPLRILIAENQYLIAMEVERMLLEMVPCDVVITPLARMADQLKASAFDIVILDAAGNEPLNVSRVDIIRAAGAEPVFLSSYGDHERDQSIVSLHPSVTKPPLPETLVAAVREAASRRHSDGESLFDDR
jgi:DNA-binding NarL/FixJ family response regulator